jgi:hypothetical protein
VMSLSDGELIQAARRSAGEVIAFPQRRDGRA